MNHPIGVVSRRTGLATDTIRAWERRYGAVRPVRDAAGRRLYAAEDVARLQRLARGVALGHPIGSLARLPDDALVALVDAAQPSPEERIGRELRRDLVAAVARSDAAACETILWQALASLSPPRAVSQVLAPAAREVGERWARGTLSIAQEHLFTARVQRVVTTAIQARRWDAERRPRLAIATLSGERHYLGCLMAAFLAAVRGFDVCELGPDLPAKELGAIASQLGARLVAIAVIGNGASANPMTGISALRDHLPEDTELWIGGFEAALGDRPLPDRCLWIGTLDAFADRLALLASD